MEVKVKSNVEYIYIEDTILKTPENFLKPDLISDSGGKDSEWYIVFLYLPK